MVTIKEKLLLLLFLLVIGVQYSLQQEVNCTLLSTYQVDYFLDFPEVNCSGGNESIVSRPAPLTMDVSCGSSAQQVMEMAANADQSYGFTVTYPGTAVGYTIDAINGTVNSDPCFWFFYHQVPGGDAVLSDSITNFIIPSNGSQVIMRYQTTPVPPPSPSPSPSPVPSPTANPSGGDNAASLLQVNVHLVLLLCLGMFIQ